MKRTHFTLLLFPLISFIPQWEIKPAPERFRESRCHKYTIIKNDTDVAYLECNSSEWCIEDPQAAIEVLIKEIENDKKEIDSLRNYIYHHSPSKTRTRFEPLKGNV